jgi:hypothetical protein
MTPYSVHHQSVIAPSIHALIDHAYLYDSVI